MTLIFPPVGDAKEEEEDAEEEEEEEDATVKSTAAGRWSGATDAEGRLGDRRGRVPLLYVAVETKDAEDHSAVVVNRQRLT